MTALVRVSGQDLVRTLHGASPHAQGGTRLAAVTPLPARQGSPIARSRCSSDQVPKRQVDSAQEVEEVDFFERGSPQYAD